jgi:hypothetical protein
MVDASGAGGAPGIRRWDPAIYDAFARGSSGGRAIAMRVAQERVELPGCGRLGHRELDLQPWKSAQGLAGGRGL